MRFDAFVLPAQELLPIVILLARVSGFFVSAPFFSSATIPRQIRAGLAFGVALLLVPTVTTMEASTLGATDAPILVLLMIKEGAIGVLLGGSVQIFFAALQLAGQVAGTQMGLSISGIIDPATMNRNNLGPAFYQLIGMMLFLGAGGHRDTLSALVESYRVLPIGVGSLSPSVLAAGTGLVQNMFEVGLRLAAPIAATLFVVDVALALAGRIAPQIPIMMLGVPAKSWLGLALLAWAMSQYPGPCLAWLGRAPASMLSLARQLAVASP